MRFTSRMMVAVFVSIVSSSLASCVGDDPSTTDDTNPNDGSVADVSASDASPTDDASTNPDGGTSLTILQVDIGDYSACALVSDGSVWCWGDNSLGELGNAPPGATAVPAEKVQGLGPATAVSVGENVACAITKDGRVWCWGVNYNGSLGHDGGDSTCGTVVCNPVPVQVGNFFASNISISFNVGCATTTSHTVVCWGDNTYGKLGVLPATLPFSAEPVPIAGLSNIVEVSQSYPGNVVCAVDTSQNLWCWGDNTYGALAHTPGTNGDAVTAPNINITPTQILNPDAGAFGQVAHVAAGAAVCAVRTDGTVWCWGDNAGGGLGNNAAADMLPHPTPTQVASLTQAVDVRAGSSTCALQDGGAVWCWGDSNPVNGGVGSSPCYSPSTGTPNTNCALAPVLVAGVNATSFDVEHVGAVAIDKTVGVVAWGGNGDGQLGHPVGTSGDVVDAGGAGTFNPVPKPVQGLP